MRDLLIELRGNKNQEDVAKELNISQQHLSEIERSAKNPSIKLMKKLEVLYGRSMVELFPDIFLDSYTTICSIKQART
jgi:transcriptional regulator with XRE-family HTH domain